MDLSGIYTIVFFQKVNEFLREEITEFQDRLLSDTFEFFGIVALTLLTIWIFYQGYMIISGRSRQSMMGLVVDSLRATLIIGIATAFAGTNSDVYEGVTDGLGRVIVGVVADKDLGPGEDPLNALYKDIDRSMAAMNLALGSIQAVQTEAGSDAEADKARNMWFAGIGTAGPAIVGGAMLTFIKFMMALFVGLGPLFIICLLFDQTKSLFQSWLMYGVVAMFTLAVLYVASLLAMDLTLALTASYWIGNTVLDNIGSQGLNNMASLQGGLGIGLTMLLMGVPFGVSNFFNKTLGNFMHYSAYSGAAAGAPSAGGPAGAPYQNGAGRSESLGDQRSAGNIPVGTYNSTSQTAGYDPTHANRATTPSSGSSNT